MSFIYAMSDVHGELGALGAALTAVDLTDPESRLVLLGDYVPHQQPGEGDAAWLGRCWEALGFVMRLQESGHGQVDVLMGNWELWLLSRVEDGEPAADYAVERWLCRLPYLKETEAQVFVHAGVDEEAGDFWRWAVDNGFLCEKYPPTFGAFEKDVVAGHVGTAQISGDPDFHGVFWDGESHYYLDGTTEESGVLPVLRYDVGHGTYDYALASEHGVGPWTRVEAMDPVGFCHGRDDDWW